MAETADMRPLSLAVDFFPRPSVLTVARTFLINSNLDPMEWIGLFCTGSLMRNLLSLSLSVVFITVCAVLPCAVQGQTQDSQTHQNQSVAEVARRNREQMKNAVRQSSVVTNDDLDTEHSKPEKQGIGRGSSRGRGNRYAEGQTCRGTKSTGVATTRACPRPAHHFFEPQLHSLSYWSG